MMLEIEHLRIEFTDRAPPFAAVEDFCLRMARGETVGIVGESGSGKTVTAHAILGLLPKTARVTGRIALEGVDLLTLPPKALREYQGREISIVFQEPMTSLDPTMRVGAQVEEALRVHTSLRAKERRAQALEAMRLAELPEPENLYRQYPHQLSGGMRQRVMLAAALVLRPKLLIADEPTTALDVTTQAQILKTLKSINRQEGTAILFISHDLTVIRTMCSRVVVMHGGRIVEAGETERVFSAPCAPYTRTLIAAHPARRARKEGTDG